MPTIIIEDFKIGLDRRRMNETSLPGSLITCENAHITRGGEIEKNEAFVRFANLPDNTFGLKAVADGFLVFGSDNITPTVISTNPSVKYQRLNDDGGVQSWGSFTISGAVTSDTFTSIKVGAQELLASTSTCPADPDDWPAQIASEITANSATSGFAAFSDGNDIYVYDTAIGTTHNGDTWTHTKTGTVTVSSTTAFSGGQAATNPSMIEVLSVELFDGVPYVVAEYDDGIVRHWYDGTKVADMYSGKARAKFTINGTTAAAAVNATGSFVIIDPADACAITSILVGTTELLAATVTYDEENDEDGFESKVTDAINDNTAVSGFRAERQAGRKIVLTYEIPGTSVNTDAVAVTTTGTITIQDETAMADGADAKQITAVEINSVEIMPTDVDWAESNQQTALAVAAAINENSDSSGYEALAYGSTVLIRATAVGTAANGHTLAVTAESGITIDDASASVQGGAILPTVVEPGRFVKTYKNKMYALSGPSVYYSAIGSPPNFETGTGSGFDNLSTNSSGSETLTAIANYFENMALFSRNNVQVWFMSDNPDENSQVQVLNNTGTIAPGSVVEFGDNDVFYLSESGIRSLRARDTTNAAFVNDVGIAIDPLIQKELLENNVKAEKAQGILEPRQGRYLLPIGETVYAFSFFPSSKISAWSTYRPGFEIVGIDSIGQTIVCRSENALYKIGSTTQRVYDAKKTKIITPFLSGDDPSVINQFVGLDMACEGTWDIYCSLDPLRVNEDGTPDEDYFEKIGTVVNTTYAETGGENGHVPMDQMSSHISLMFISKGSGRARIGNVAVHIAPGGEKQ